MKFVLCLLLAIAVGKASAIPGLGGWAKSAEAEASEEESKGMMNMVSGAMSLAGDGGDSDSESGLAGLATSVMSDAMGERGKQMGSAMGLLKKQNNILKKFAQDQAAISRDAYECFGDEIPALFSTLESLGINENSAVYKMLKFVVGSGANKQSA